ncbi:MAG: bifunctional phosphopantothenoylcysteine decarboxylase/phosphopantothenate--cysteine ligase CoaBC [Anaerolineales bacterium]|nr:bifunctional phosphopantothenoylcysteine decarboxylase/phosphopantothenate--cysteine ligase CoaBC [Anaerolineales bacterium]
MNPIQGKHILLGVTGSIAAYKAVDLASKLAQAGAEVDVLLTEAATRFVSPLSFQSVTGRSAHTDAELWGAEAHVLHVNLGRPADLLLVAPVTANTIAKFAHGLADNLLSLTALSARCPLMIAPAMDGGMFSSIPNQENLHKLISRGVIVVGPEEGHLASGLSARGRMTEPGEILNRVRHLLARGGRLCGRKVIVTAGGTQEPLDPVRMLTNRSSGKQGFAITQAALDEGAEVTLIAGPVALESPCGAKRVDVKTAEEMRAAVLTEAAVSDALIMAAAVADFRPGDPAPRKLKKSAAPNSIRLERTQDILTAVSEAREKSGRPLMTIGFSAETEDLETNARKKLKAKGLDLIVANVVGRADSGFETETNRVTLFSADGSAEALPLMEKSQVAEAIIERVIVQFTKELGK